ncbi:MAG: hypothetical protein V4772_08925 [Pseudomonadota bacterium]
MNCDRCTRSMKKPFAVVNGVKYGPKCYFLEFVKVEQPKKEKPRSKKAVRLEENQLELDLESLSPGPQV